MNKEYVQCNECGNIHQVKMEFNIEDLYVNVKCPHCGRIVSHLWVGSKKEDIYMYYDPVKDPRFYNYNTK